MIRPTNGEPRMFLTYIRNSNGTTTNGQMTPELRTSLAR